MKISLMVFNSIIVVYNQKTIKGKKRRIKNVIIGKHISKHISILISVVCMKSRNELKSSSHL